MRSTANMINSMLEKFWVKYQNNGTVDFEILDALTDLIASETYDTARYATQKLFSVIIEPLLDSFMKKDRNVYYKIFARIFQKIRKFKNCQHIHKKLEEFGLYSE